MNAKPAAAFMMVGAAERSAVDLRESPAGRKDTSSSFATRPPAARECLPSARLTGLPAGETAGVRIHFKGPSISNFKRPGPWRYAARAPHALSVGGLSTLRLAQEHRESRDRSRGFRSRLWRGCAPPQQPRRG